MARIVSTRFIEDTLRSRDIYNWTTFDDDEPIVIETQQKHEIPITAERSITRKRRLTAARVRRFREREKLQKNSAMAVSHH